MSIGWRGLISELPVLYNPDMNPAKMIGGNTMAKNSNEQDVYFQKAWSGDYSQFEKLDSDRRNKLAQDYMAEYCARYPELGR